MDISVIKVLDRMDIAHERIFFLQTRIAICAHIHYSTMGKLIKQGIPIIFH